MIIYTSDLVINPRAMTFTQNVSSLGEGFAVESIIIVATDQGSEAEFELKETLCDAEGAVLQWKYLATASAVAKTKRLKGWSLVLNNA